MKTTLPYPKPSITSRPAKPPRPTGGNENDRMTQLAFYFFASLLVIAFLYFVMLTFFL